MDVGGQSDQHDNGDRVKAGFSDALKPAVVGCNLTLRIRSS
jgi:hypothetical protein